jgi:hypothetical protein
MGVVFHQGEDVQSQIDVVQSQLGSRRRGSSRGRALLLFWRETVDQRKGNGVAVVSM